METSRIHGGDIVCIRGDFMAGIKPKKALVLRVNQDTVTARVLDGAYMRRETEEIDVELIEG